MSSSNTKTIWTAKSLRLQNLSGWYRVVQMWMCWRLYRKVLRTITDIEWSLSEYITMSCAFMWTCELFIPIWLNFCIFFECAGKSCMIRMRLNYFRVCVMHWEVMCFVSALKDTPVNDVSNWELRDMLKMIRSSHWNPSLLHRVEI